MPIFEYVCEDCGNKFEKLVRGSQNVNCPSCGQDHLEQQFSTFAARADGASHSVAEMPSCPSGMCGTPGLCGRN
jgi:putative FmdB family regulatory protein